MEESKFVVTQMSKTLHTQSRSLKKVNINPTLKKYINFDIFGI